MVMTALFLRIVLNPEPAGASRQTRLLLLLCHLSIGVSVYSVGYLLSGSAVTERRWLLRKLGLDQPNPK
jgi:hypothetical protein